MINSERGCAHIIYLLIYIITKMSKIKWDVENVFFLSSSFLSTSLMKTIHHTPEHPSDFFLSKSLDTRQIRTSLEHVYVRHKISFSWAAESKTRPDMNLKYNLSLVPTVLHVNADWKSLMSDLEYSTSGGALWGSECITELFQDTAGVQPRSVITFCQGYGEHQS